MHPYLQPSKGRHLVLVANDDPHQRRLISWAVEQLGLVAQPVGDGASAIVAVAMNHHAFACAILAVQMPIVNGIDAAHAIQRTAPDLPIVLISGSAPTTYASRIHSLHLAGMLDKPFTIEVLQQLLCDILGAAVVCQKERSYGG